jgi:hypothetical protein
MDTVPSRSPYGYDMLFLRGHGTVTLSITTLTALNNDYWVELNIIFLQYKIGDTVTRNHGTVTLSNTILTALKNDYWVELNIIWPCRCGRDQAYGPSLVACSCETAIAFDLSVNRASTPTPWYHANHGNRAPALPGYTGPTTGCATNQVACSLCPRRRG